MAGLLFNTVAGLYTLFQLRQRSLSVDKKEGEGAVESKKLHTYVETPHKNSIIQTTTNANTEIANGTQPHSN
jgi:hypothetical protein